MDGLPHLIVLRGNSASGKTTIAGALQRELGRGTANIGQDHLRRVVLREHDVPGGDNIGLIAQTVRYCTGKGYNVIVEGILVAEHYRDMLLEILAEHPGPTHVFYLDVPLEETVRRHGTRPLGAELPVDKLREWYVPSDTLGVPGEVVLHGDDDLASTVRQIRDVIGPVPSREPAARGRFR